VKVFFLKVGQPEICVNFCDCWIQLTQSFESFLGVRVSTFGQCALRFGVLLFETGGLRGGVRWQQSDCKQRCKAEAQTKRRFQFGKAHLCFSLDSRFTKTKPPDLSARRGRSVA